MLALGLPSLSGAGQQEPTIHVRPPQVGTKSLYGREVWEQALAATFKSFKGNLVIDVSESSLKLPPPRLSDKQGQELARIALLSNILKKKLIAGPGGFVIRRSSETATTEFESIEQVTKWLNDAPDDELRSMLSTGIPYAYLKPETQALMVRFCTLPGISAEIAEDHFVSAELRLSVAGHAVDVSGKPHVLFLDGASRFREIEVERRLKLKKSYAPPDRAADSVPNNAVGDLNVFPGELVLVSDICERASKVFHLQLNYDGRLGSSYCYVQGSFSQKSFLSYMQELGRTIPFGYSSGTRATAMQALLAAMRKRLPSVLDQSLAAQGLPYDAVLQGQQYSAKTLEDSFPNLAADLKQLNIDENSMITLSPMLTLQLVGEGSYKDPADPPNMSPTGNNLSATFGLFPDER